MATHKRKRHHIELVDVAATCLRLPQARVDGDEELQARNFSRKGKLEKVRQHKKKMVASAEAQQHESGGQKPSATAPMEGGTQGFHSLPCSTPKMVHALRNSSLSRDRKIELACEFLEAYEMQEERGGLRKEEWIAMPQFVCFLSDWLQSEILGSCKDGIMGKKEQGLVNGGQSIPACLNARYWRSLHWCLCFGVGSVSPSILKGIVFFVDRAAMGEVDLEGGCCGKRVSGGGGKGLVDGVTEVLHVLLVEHERSFRPSFEQWFAVASAALNLAQATGMTTVASRPKGDVTLLHILVLIVFEGFARFVRLCPYPRRVFEALVDKLLAPLFVALEGLRCDPGYLQKDGDMSYLWHRRLSKAMQDVLADGLFHGSHVGELADTCVVLVSREEPPGCIGTTSKKRARSQFSNAYLRHLFDKVQHVRTEGDVETLNTLGFVLRAYARKLKAQSAPSTQEVFGMSGKESIQVQEDAAEEQNDKAMVTPNSQKVLLRQNEKLFAVFAELSKPFVGDLEEMLNNLPSNDKHLCTVILPRAMHLLGVVNSLLSAAKDEHVYVPTEDTPTEAHLGFLKHLQCTVTKAAKVLAKTWSQALQNGCVHELAANALSVMKQVVWACGHLLHLEYRVTEQHLSDTWLILLLALAMEDTTEAKDARSHKYKLASDVAQVACRIIQTYSDLRQVDLPVLLLCSCLRTLMTGEFPVTGMEITFESGTVPCLLMSKAGEKLVASKAFLSTIVSVMKNLPEGQTAQVVRALSTDLMATLEVLDKPAGDALNSQTDEVAKCTDAGIKALSEMYAQILENVNVTSTNSVLVGAAVRKAVSSGMSVPLATLIDVSTRKSCTLGLNRDIDRMTKKRKKTLNGTSKGKRRSSKAASDVGSEDCELSPSRTYLLLRTFLGCRSLERQTRSLMPPKAAKKASAEVGEPFLDLHSVGSETVGSGLKERSFFSWIRRGTEKVPEVIRGIAGRVVGRLGGGCSALAYVLDCVALQRVEDVRQHLRMLEFLPSRFNVSTDAILQGDDAFFVELVASLKEELMALVAFMSKDIASFKQIIALGLTDSDVKMCENVGDNANDVGNTPNLPIIHDTRHRRWDLTTSTLKPETLPVARWRLLCRTVDVWSEHARDNTLRDFVACLLTSYQSRGAARSGTVVLNGGGGHRETTSVEEVTEEVLRDSRLFEQHQLRSILTSVFREQMMSCLPSISLKKESDNRLLQDVRQTIKRIKKDFGDIGNPVESNSDKVSGAPKSVRKALQRIRKMIDGTNPNSDLSPTLKRCTSLLEVLCQLPRGYFTSDDAVIHASQLMKLERYLICALLDIREAVRYKLTHFTVSKPGCRLQDITIDLLTVFSRSRRALKSLASSVNKERCDVGSMLMCKLFESGEATSWLTLSVYAASGVLSDLEKVCKGLTPIFQTCWDLLYATMGNTAQVLSYICGNIFCEEASLLLVTSEQEDSVKATNAPCGSEDVSQSLLQLNDSLLGQVHVLEGRFRPSSLSLDQKDWLGALAVFSAVSAYLWSMASAVEGLNECCRDGNSRDLKWQAGLPSNWLLSIQKLEPILINSLLHLVNLEASEVDLSAKRQNSAAVSNGPGAITEESEDEDVSMEEDAPSGNADSKEASDDVYGDSDIEDTEVSEGKKWKRAISKGALSSDENPLAVAANDRERRLPVDSTMVSDFTMFELLSLFVGPSSQGEKTLEILNGILQGTEKYKSDCVGELFLSMAALLRLRSLCFSPFAVGPASKSLDQFGKSDKTLPYWLIAQIGVAHWLLSGAVSSIHTDSASGMRWLLGVAKFMESVGSFLPCISPSIPVSEFCKLIDLHMRLLGALVPSRKEVEQAGGVSGPVQSEADCDSPWMETKSYKKTGKFLGPADLPIALRQAIQNSFGTLLKDCPRQHFILALQLVENSVVHVSATRSSGVRFVGGIERHAAAGIQCIAIIFRAVTSKSRLRLLANHCSAFLSSIFSLVSKLQVNVLCKDSGHNVGSRDTVDGALVMLQCLEIITMLGSRAALFPMTASQISLGLHLPALLFQSFCRAHVPAQAVLQYLQMGGISTQTSTGNKGNNGEDTELSVKLYVACCKLLCSLLRHRTRQAGHCIALLGESVKILLRCLGVPNWHNPAHQHADFKSWSVADAIVCASWLRRVYEELGEQKSTLGKYSAHLLAEYICVISGSGSIAGGLKREVETVLRPGAFALVDTCTPRDLQQLYITLSDGPQRGTLTSLRNDYERHFKYVGKV